MSLAPFLASSNQRAQSTDKWHSVAPARVVGYMFSFVGEVVFSPQNSLWSWTYRKLGYTFACLCTAFLLKQNGWEARALTYFD